MWLYMRDRELMPNIDDIVNRIPATCDADASLSGLNPTTLRMVSDSVLSADSTSSPIADRCHLLLWYIFVSMYHEDVQARRAAVQGIGMVYDDTKSSSDVPERLRTLAICRLLSSAFDDDWGVLKVAQTWLRIVGASANPLWTARCRLIDERIAKFEASDSWKALTGSLQTK